MKKWFFFITVLVFVFTTGCVSQPDKAGNAIILRDAKAAMDGIGDGHELARIMEQADAKIKAHGRPDKAILPVDAPQAQKDEESKENAAAIVASAGFWGGLFGGKMGIILSVLGSLGGVGMLLYTGRWGLAAKQVIALFTEGVEKGKTNGELKKFLSSNLKGTGAGKLLDGYVRKAEKLVEAAKPEPRILTRATVTETNGPGVSTPPEG